MTIIYLVTSSLGQQTLSLAKSDVLSTCVKHSVLELTEGIYVRQASCILFLVLDNTTKFLLCVLFVLLVLVITLNCSTVTAIIISIVILIRTVYFVCTV